MENKDYVKRLLHFKKTLDEWAQITIQNTENELTNGLVRGVLETSHLIDQFSTWLLAGTAATAVAVISNLDTLIKYTGEFHYKLALWLVCASLVFGVFQKVAALYVSLTRRGEEFGRALASSVFPKHESVEKQIEEMACPHKMVIDTEVDLNRVFSKFVNVYPRPLRSRLARRFVKLLENPLYGSELAVRYNLW